jgi:UDP-4-amino-4,6-dideoxy-N-acetyl-beta-L-altrosamine transaminase
MIPYGKHFVDEEDIEAVVRQLRDRTLTQGAVIDEFERAVAQYVGARYAVAISSGTAALHLACAAAGLGPGDRVLTSAMTFVASANCALYVGAAPAFADIDPDTLNLDPADLERRCRSLGSVAAIIPVHFAGLACDMPAIRAVAKRYGAKVIEDASHAIGGRYADGRRIGCCAHSDMTVFSFHPVKQITTGEGGMVTTNDERLYRDLLRLRSHGINKGDDPLLLLEHALTAGKRNRWYYEMQELGFNYRLTEIQAALGLSQLRKLDRFLERRRALVARYDEAFRGNDRIRPAQLPGRSSSAHHLYIIRQDSVPRNEVMERLSEAGFITQVHYIPVPLHPYYQKLGHRASDYPNAWSYYTQALSIPLFFSLADEDQDRFIESARRLIR